MAHYPSHNSDQDRERRRDEVKKVYVKDRRADDQTAIAQGAVIDAMIREQNMNKSNGMESHIQTGIAAVVLMLIGWVGYSITSLKETTVAMAVSDRQVVTELNYLKSDLRTAVANNYTKEDAQRDILQFSEKVTDLSVRVKHMEKQLGAVVMEHKTGAHKSK